MSQEKEVLLSVSHLKKYFNVGKNAVLKAVDDVSFDIYKGETLGMVGESGCGKTTCGRTCIGLYDRTDGKVLYKGSDVHSITGKDRQAYKKEVQMVFQDPYGSLDPRMTVAEIIGEETGARPLLLHSCHNVTRKELEDGITYADLMRQNIENLRRGLDE